MTDTPEPIKELQLQIWLSKTPGERLRQFMEDNDAMYRFWDQMKEAERSKKMRIAVNPLVIMNQEISNNTNLSFWIYLLVNFFYHHLFIRLYFLHH